MATSPPAGGRIGYSSEALDQFWHWLSDAMPEGQLRRRRPTDPVQGLVHAVGPEAAVYSCGDRSAAAAGQARRAKRSKNVEYTPSLEAPPKKTGSANLCVGQIGPPTSGTGAQPPRLQKTRGACAAAVPSYHLRRPVRLCLDRDEDMQMTGQRHAFLSTYKVGFTADGRVLTAELDLYHNTGNSHDLSHSIMERALLHSDCCYKANLLAGVRMSLSRQA
ncbi:Xanthine dehydrogenase 1 [Tetrabaena socialis]|uniref:Xanthine dehydrogenase 1 n=1 Tax=Tetrabaena socialis TaxID=47790 RepID=A0A2J7ZSA3_9CHLO|nr:Xanthine dehydrogenase 1 [Tetrabaena socialis]|eukprot:PNH03147.1 Xanthine dehydrogenase 1 [Tetrabaena socialis]